MAYTAFTLPLGAVPVPSWSRFWSDIGSVYTARWSKGANAIIEAETSCFKITCCNMAVLPIWSLVPELACLSVSSPPSSFQSSLTGRKPPSSFESSLTGRRRRASRRRLADYRRRRSRRSVLVFGMILAAIMAGNFIHRPREVWTRER